MLKLATYLLKNFGTLFVFYAVYHFFELRAALIASMLYAGLETAILFARKEKPTTLFKLTTGMTLAFGALDLWLAAPVFFKYEAAVSNIFTGVIFAATLYGPKTLIQEFVEKREPARPMTPLRIFRCRVLTRIWVGYFFLKAVAYVWLGSQFSLEKALAIRTTIGTASLYGLLGFSIFLSRPFFERLENAGIMKRPS